MKKLNIKTLVISILGYIVGALYIKFFLDIDIVPFFNDREDILKIFSMGCFIAFLHYQIKPKKFMPGEEKGTARFGTLEDIKHIIDEEDDNNVLFTETEKMALDTRKTRKNLNQLILGGSGAGKTRFFIKPNLMQLNTSFVITDPKGEILRSCGKMLKNDGYKVKVFNLIDMEKSSNYNPLKYVKKESDVLKLIANLIKNTNSETATGGDGFWEKSETALLQAIIFYILEEGLEAEKNFSTVMQLLLMAEVKEENENHVSDLDKLFNKLRKKNPEHIAIKQYDTFKLAGAKTAKSILISAGVRLAVFSIKEVKSLIEKDNLDLERIGDEKTALFIVIPDSDATFNFLVSMMYTQLFNILYYQADFVGYKNENNKIVKGRLKYHVRFMLDEFANIGSIPEFDKLIATMRSRELSVAIVLQNLAQIKGKYEKTWESITGNCDSLLFLGGNEWDTLKYISEMLGKQTIDIRTSGKTRGSQGSSSLNYQVDGRELMMPEELKLMPDSDCILFIRGIRPFKSKKINLEKHKRFFMTEDADIDNSYSLDEYKSDMSVFMKEKSKKEIENNSIVMNTEQHELENMVLISYFENLEKVLSGNPKFEKIKKEIIGDIANKKIITREQLQDILRDFNDMMPNLEEEQQEEDKQDLEKIEFDNNQKVKSINDEINENSIVFDSDEERLGKELLVKAFSELEEELENNPRFEKIKEDILKQARDDEKISDKEVRNVVRIIKQELGLKKIKGVLSIFDDEPLI